MNQMEKLFSPGARSQTPTSHRSDIIPSKIMPQDNKMSKLAEADLGQAEQPILAGFSRV